MVRSVTQTTTSNPDKTSWAEMFVNLHIAYTKLTRAQLELEDKTHQIEEAHDLLQLVIESMSEALFLLDPSGRVIRANMAASRLLEREMEELEGVYFTNLVSTDELPATAWQLLEHHQAKSSNRIEVEISSQSGRIIPISASCELVRDRWKKIIGLLIIAEDITERKRAEEALRQKSQELARSNTELEQYAYVVSHDLQEPLRMITSFTQLLSESYRDRLDEQTNEYMDFIIDGARRMQMLIRDLLTFSRVGRKRKPFAPTDCSAIFAAVCRSLGEMIRESSATVTSGQLPVLMGDQSQITQLFQNLISNAIKYRGDRAPEVHVSAEQQESHYLFRVRDNGIGIDPDQANRIFSMFQRLHTADEYPGTGIGLAICKKIVEQHAGKIWVESEPGKGSTFCFTLSISGTDSHAGEVSHDGDRMK